MGEVAPVSTTVLRFVRMVGVRGFEPRASWLQTRRSTQAELHPAAARRERRAAKTDCGIKRNSA